jgi:hypothetical protein
MTIKIYGMPYSTCTARVLATLAEKEVEDYELVPVDLSVGAHKKPEFLKMQVLVPSSGHFALFGRKNYLHSQFQFACLRVLISEETLYVRCCSRFVFSDML